MPVRIVNAVWVGRLNFGEEGKHFRSPLTEDCGMIPFKGLQLWE